MSIASETHKVIYVCDGSTTEFDYTFKIFDEDEIEVVLYTVATGAETVLVMGTNYTVDGVGEDVGGTVSVIAEVEGEFVPYAYSNAYRLILRRKIPITQVVDYIANDDFPAETHEEALDRIVMMIQQMDEKFERSILRDASATSTLDFPVLSAGWLYCDGSSLSFADSPTAVDYAGTLAFGADASKSASPSAGDYYVATDTDKLYVCFTTNTWTEMGKDLDAGVDASKSATPAVGDIYIATDTDKLYVCFTTNTWTEMAQVASVVALTGDQTVAGIKTFGSFPVTPSSAPTTDYQVANKKYADDRDVLATAFGSYSSKTSSYGNQQAATAGFVVATGVSAVNDGESTLEGYTDSSATPTTKVARSRSYCPGTVANAFICFPVKKSDYWRVELIGGNISTVFWVPFGV